MSFKTQVRNIHKWLGLTSGLIVFIVSITGCIFCFQDEIKDITREESRFVVNENKPYLPPSILIEKAKIAVPKSTTSTVVYVAPNRSAVVYTNSAAGYKYVFMNPYSGKTLFIEDPTTDFFIIVEYIHLYLLLPDYIGKHIVAGATIIFIFMLITGIIQWWPKRRSDIKRSFNVKWSAKWRRVNYDWHNVSGFYISIVAFIIAFTGLVFAYDWAGDTIYYTANLGKGDKEAESKAPAIDSTKYATINIAAADKAMAATMKMNPNAEMFFITLSEKKDQPVTTGAYKYTLRFDHQSNYHFHPGDGSLLKSEPHEQKSFGLQLNEMNYGIHTGQILDLPGKIIAFTASLIAAALPVTGFIIWYGRRKKTKKKPSPARN
ncbi:PepSY-associated TM helix domain-containing protein [Flavobacterium sp. 3HN19-14]|uniref:PepSY-associated TM helix domain-containing protein n=1 Tax=Flavobacterium sp. 3HN19-14 TaxID=3448133 RepID=UPI003EE0D88D